VRDDMQVKRSLPSLVVLVAGVGILAGISPLDGQSRPAPAPRFPTDQARWIGTPPTWESLRGRVVLLDVWTFG
jgi:hypothetical protein